MNNKAAKNTYQKICSLAVPHFLNKKIISSASFDTDTEFYFFYNFKNWFTTLKKRNSKFYEANYNINQDILLNIFSIINRKAVLLTFNL